MPKQEKVEIQVDLENMYIHKMLAMQTLDYEYTLVDIDYLDLLQILRVAVVEREVRRSDALHELYSLSWSGSADHR